MAHVEMFPIGVRALLLHAGEPALFLKMSRNTTYQIFLRVWDPGRLAEGPEFAEVSLL